MLFNETKQLTSNFNIREFVHSDFYNKLQQRKVIKSVDRHVLRNIDELAQNLQVLRNVLDSPITINIAFRPLWWERQQGRSGRSQHVKGKAADIIAEGYTTRQIYNAIEYLIKTGQMKEGGLGYYDTFIHYDIRGYEARW